MTQARLDGAASQAVLDRAAYSVAAADAAARQGHLVRQLVARQATISKETDDALMLDVDNLGRRYDDLRMRWAAARASGGGTSEDGAVAVPTSATGFVEAACEASGWVDFETASAAAQAADEAIAKDDAWIAWAEAQRLAWPTEP